MERVSRSTHTKGAAGGEGRVRAKLGEGVWPGGGEVGRWRAESQKGPLDELREELGGVSSAKN